METIQLIDKTAIYSPVSKSVSLEEHKKIRPNQMARRLTFLFKQRKALDVDIDFARFLYKKYPNSFETPGIDRAEKVESGVKMITKIKTMEMSKLRTLAARFRVGGKGSHAELVAKVQKCIDNEVIPISEEKWELIRKARLTPYKKYRTKLIALHKKDPDKNPYPYTPEDDGVKK